MITTTNINQNQAYEIGNALGVNWQSVDINQFRRGLEVELEHGNIDKNTDVTHNDMMITAKIALAHLNELSDYYSRLEIIENVNTSAYKNNNILEKSNTSLYAGLALGVAASLFFKFLKNRKS